MTEKEVRFMSWKELLKAIPRYEKLGYECEVRGWEGMQQNKMIIRDSLRGERNDGKRID